MSGFFKPLRRKIGVVTLVVACALMGLWIRGHGVTDLYEFGSGVGKTFHTLVLSQHGIMWIREDVFGDSTLGWTPGWKITTPSNSLHNEKQKVDSDSGIAWRYSRFGFDFCQLSNGTNYLHRQGNIPYWPIVVPLTLLSAWLLLSKPRAKKNATDSAVPQPVS